MSLIYQSFQIEISQISSRWRFFNPLITSESQKVIKMVAIFFISRLYKNIRIVDLSYLVFLLRKTPSILLLRKILHTMLFLWEITLSMSFYWKKTPSMLFLRKKTQTMLLFIKITHSMLFFYKKTSKLSFWKLTHSRLIFW